MTTRIRIQIANGIGSWSARADEKAIQRTQLWHPRPDIQIDASVRPNWIGAHTRALEYFGGTTAILVADNTKTTVPLACRYEPEANRTYAEMAVEETLRNLGLPPNPTEYDPGFLVWETDGKLKTGVVGSDSHPIADCMVPPDQTGALEATISAHVLKK